MMEVAAAVLALSLVAAACVASLGWLWFHCVRLRRRLAEQSMYQSDLLRLAELARRVTGADWQSGIQVVLHGLVQMGYGGGAAVLSLSEEGHLEQRSAYGQVDSGWEADRDGEVAAVLQDGEGRIDRRGRRALLPLVEEGERLGLLAVTGLQCQRSQGAERSQLAFLTGAAGLASLTLGGLRSLKEQATLSSTDGLTGLPNRRHLNHQLGVALAKSYLENLPLVLILLDIDEFKRVNDTYGHLFGDLVIRHVAGVIRGVVPASAALGRYGGEEFVIVLPEGDVTVGTRLAELVRVSIAESPVLDLNSGTPVRITVSAGVAVYQLGQGKTRLIARADEALYASKRSGRNRVTVAPADPDPGTAQLSAVRNIDVPAGVS